MTLINSGIFVLINWKKTASKMNGFKYLERWIKFYGLLRIFEFTKLPPIHGLWEKRSPRLAIMWLHGKGLTGLSGGLTIKCPTVQGSSWIQSRQLLVSCGFVDAIFLWFSLVPEREKKIVYRLSENLDSLNRNYFHVKFSFKLSTYYLKAAASLT